MDRKSLKTRIAVGFKGLARLGKRFSKQPPGVQGPKMGARTRGGRGGR